MAVNEITEVVLKSRIRTALEALPGMIEGVNDQHVQHIYENGNFQEFVGVVGKATATERLRAAGTARRLGHTQTAALITKGK